MLNTVSEAISHAPPVQPAQPGSRAWRRWLKPVVLVIILAWIATEGFSLAIQHTRLRRVLTVRMEAAFGRPVEVGSYHFSLWTGPALEASSVTVGEDPRFGQEYFLRAESMSVRLRWTSLLRGRVELGTLSLYRPSLNLVRNAGGDWNLAEWLPQPLGRTPQRVPVGPVPPSRPLRFSRIEVDGGRINFKNGDEKLPFAFVSVSGTVETDRPGRWRMDLEAAPWRAGVVVQQAGTIHVAGDVGGTSSRLRPAEFDVSWTEASLSDVLRLATGNDAGLRGELGLVVGARTLAQGDAWNIQGRVQLQQVHRWDLAPRADNPSVNLITHATWQPASSDLALSDVSLEAPHSNAHASGRISWSSVGEAASGRIPPVQFDVSSSQIDTGDLLPWLRAFHAGVADNLSLRGLARVRAGFVGWPVRIVEATVSTDVVDLSGAGLRRPAHLAPIQLHDDHGVISLLPATLYWGASAAEPEGLFRIDAISKPGRGAVPAWHIAGSTAQVRELIAGAGAFGWNVSRGWNLAGPFSCDLLWPEMVKAEPAGESRQPTGWIEIGDPAAQPGGATLGVPFLNLPVTQIKARAEWKPGNRHVVLASAQAFGARWSGTFDRRESAGDWQFALSADRLVAADLDRWLNPAWRQSFLGRMLPFFNSQPQASAAPESLRASGRLTLGEFSLAPLGVRRLEGDLKIDGRRIDFTNARGQFYGGEVGGSLSANLQAVPAYHADLDFSRVDMPAFFAALPGLAGFSAQTAAGQISLDARGSTRADIAASFVCQGALRADGIELSKLDLSEAIGVHGHSAAAGRFPNGTAAFSCAQRKIDFQSLRLATGFGDFVLASGAVDFSRNLDLRLRVRPVPRDDADANASSAAFHLTGSLADPQVTRVPPLARRSH